MFLVLESVYVHGGPTDSRPEYISDDAVSSIRMYLSKKEAPQSSTQATLPFHNGFLLTITTFPSILTSHFVLQSYHCLTNYSWRYLAQDRTDTALTVGQIDPFCRAFLLQVRPSHSALLQPSLAGRRFALHDTGDSTVFNLSQHLLRSTK